MSSVPHVAVIGAGSWGTAVAGLVAAHAPEVRLWSHTQILGDYLNAAHHNPRYIVDYNVPQNVWATSSMHEAVEGAEALWLVVPSAHVRATSAAMAPYLAQVAPAAVLAKGIEPKTGLLMAGVAAEELGNPQRICALSGPNHAEEVSKNLPAGAVLAGECDEALETLRDLIASPTFRVYLSHDLTGVEVCGAVKNVIAIACGMAAGAGLGDNTLAMIMTRGLAEMTRLASALGAEALTCMGLAGMGDLVATCTSPHSRNRSFGEQYVRGVTLEAYESGSHMVVEGAAAARSVLELARARGVEMPLTESVHAVLFEHASLDDAFDFLTHRSARSEFYGIGA